MVERAGIRVDGSSKIRLSRIDPGDTGKVTDKGEAKQYLNAERKRIQELQERLFAEHRQSLLIVLQATDTGGKDGAIKSVLDGVNPQGCQVRSFKEPSEEELGHDIFWRYHEHTPPRGMITIFNRSHYEEVLVVRVRKLVPDVVWQERYEMINAFESILSSQHTRILKFFLHISKEEQKERLQARLDDPAKHWKFSVGDLTDRELWNDYQQAFEDAINRCSKPEAPWIVVPANRKWFRNLVVARTIADTLEDMNPAFPPSEPGLESITIPG